MWAFLKWTAIILTFLVVGMVRFILVFDWNGARGIETSWLPIPGAVDAHGHFLKERR